MQDEVQLDAAESWIFGIKKSDPLLHAQFTADAQAWIERVKGEGLRNIFQQVMGDAPVAFTAVCR